MEKLAGAISRALTHTRVVMSGSYPLYRLMAVCAVVSGALQLIQNKIPPSVSSVVEDAPEYYDYIFIGLQFVGALLILIGLYLEREDTPSPDKMHLSLTIERTGLTLLFTSLMVYIFSVCVQNSGPPTSMVSWFGVAFCFYSVKRYREIQNGIKELRR